MLGDFRLLSSHPQQICGATVLVTTKKVRLDGNKGDLFQKRQKIYSTCFGILKQGKCNTWLEDQKRLRWSAYVYFTALVDFS